MGKQYFGSDEWKQEMAAYNDAFRGDVVDEEQMKRLDKLRRLCMDISGMNEHIESPFFVFDKYTRNGTAGIKFGNSEWVFDKEIMARIAELFASADDFCISCLGGDGISLTFGVKDMWSEYHHEGYDE